MKKVIMSSALAVSMAVSVFAGQKTTYEIKPDVSSVEWNGKKLSGEHSGTLQLKKGKVDVVDGKLTGGVFEIDMTTISNTDLQGEWKTKLEGHLKSEDFFATDKFPVATLEIIKSEFIKDRKYNITAKLTIKGITHEITFPATVETADNKFAAYADITVDRTKYDVRYGSKKFYEDIGDKMIYDNFSLKVKIAATN